MDLHNNLARLSEAVLISETPQFALLSKCHSCHSVSNNPEQESLAASLIQRVPELALCSPKPLDGGLLQRLDFETSGAMVLAKSLSDWTLLHTALSETKTKKTYLVILDGLVSEKVSVDGWIGSPYRRAKKMQLSSASKAPKRFLPSHSLIEPLHCNAQYQTTLARVSLNSARRHQVRLHCSNGGTPLLGDSLYGSKRAISEFGTYSNTPSFILHAESVSFEWMGGYLQLKTPTPPYLLSLANHFGLESIDNCLSAR
jgi:23S rRNA-/tRNA-specific pseudouridylate synthase